MFRRPFRTGWFADALPATMWLANFRLSLRDEAERRQARHICRNRNQTRFQAPFGGRAQAPEYAASTGLGNSIARGSTKISLLTELSDGARLCPQDQSQRVEGRRRLKIFCGVGLRTCCGRSRIAGHSRAPTATRLQHSARRWSEATTLGEQAK